MLRAQEASKYEARKPRRQEVTKPRIQGAKKSCCRFLFLFSSFPSLLLSFFFLLSSFSCISCVLYVLFLYLFLPSFCISFFLSLFFSLFLSLFFSLFLSFFLSFLLRPGARIFCSFFFRSLLGRTEMLCFTIKSRILFVF